MANTGYKINPTYKRVTDDVNEYPVDENGQLTSVSGLPQYTKAVRPYDPNYRVYDETFCPLPPPVYDGKWIIDEDEIYCEEIEGPPGTTYYNSSRSQNFTRNNCSSEQTGSIVTYTVQSGVYTSTISQQDADNQAQADIDANGQNYANINGTCITLEEPQITGLTGGVLQLLGVTTLASRYTVDVNVVDIDSIGYGNRSTTMTFGPPTSTPDSAYQRYAIPPANSLTPSDIVSYFTTVVAPGPVNTETRLFGAIDISRVMNLASVGQRISYQFKFTKVSGDAVNYPDTSNTNSNLATGFRHAPSGSLSATGILVPTNTLKNILLVPSSTNSSITINGYIRRDSTSFSIYYNIINS